MSLAQATTAESDRERLRRLVVEHAPLVKLLRELYPSSTPPLNATDREIGAFIGQQQLVERLEFLLAQASNPAVDGKLRQVLGRR